MDNSHKSTDERLILLTGATGYIGGRLLKELERRGSHTIRCLARRPEYLKRKVAASTEVVQGDAFNKNSLVAAMEGVHTAYYLVHSLAGKGSFEENDRLAANTFGAAAREAKIQKMIYLGGLGEGENLSHHLSSRQEVGEILRESGVPTIEFRASIILGSGSLSFELVRALVERLPIMTTPKWVRLLAQPMAIEDVIAYLAAAFDYEITESIIFQIGGADKVSYEGIMREYARVRGLKRIIIPVPLLTPWLSSLWLALVTPLYFRVGRRLIEGVTSATTVTDERALSEFPIKPRGVREAVERALANEDQEFSETWWSDALGSMDQERRWGGVRFKTRQIDSREVKVSCSASEAFRQVQCVGGEYGWYRYNWLWNLRGLMDQLLGGVGIRRGRRNPQCLLPGDAVDFWRVEAVEENRLVRLASELKAPGRAWFQYEIEEHDGGVKIRQTAIFDPMGVLGLLYWYVLYPLHVIVFQGTLNGIANALRPQKNSREDIHSR